jgi:hypothetical protein
VADTTFLLDASSRETANASTLSVFGLVEARPVAPGLAEHVDSL